MASSALSRCVFKVFSFLMKKYERRARESLICVYLPERDKEKANETEQKMMRGTETRQRFLYIAYNKRSFAHYLFSRFAQFPKCCRYIFLFFSFWCLFFHSPAQIYTPCARQSKRARLWKNICKFYTWYAYNMLRFTFIYFEWIIFHSLSFLLLIPQFDMFYPKDVRYTVHAYLHCKYKPFQREREIFSFRLIDSVKMYGSFVDTTIFFIPLLIFACSFFYIQHMRLCIL